ncbi:stage V sporulation protein B [Gorillibacterium massiliense]|uniref:stage V sporulation protein B n=1 Tax=Gorillibacterium massiliense TaxID=1280390 RepID=UPI0005926B96|nr:stage V sporulation protein B [Gorillibacterium massiliense]
MQGAMILLAAGAVNRLLGFIPRITLPRVIGAEGVGLYQMAWPLLTVILTLVTGGIPLAVAKLVAEAESEGNTRKIRQVLSQSLTLTVTMGFALAGLCLAAAPIITRTLFTDERVLHPFLAMLPIVPIVGVSSVFRGYFQGKQNMIPTASSQTAETISRIAGMLILSYLLLPYGIGYAAAGGMLGTLAGEIVGMAVILAHYRSHVRSRTNSPENSLKQLQEPPYVAAKSRRATFRKLIQITTPVTASRLVGSFSYFFESVLTVQSLAIAGVATAAATAQYGALQGMVLPVLLLPGVLTYSLSVSLVPSLSEAAARNDMVTIHKRLHQSIKLALVTGAPFAVFMYILADPICYYLYHNSEIGVMLKMLAPAAVFIYCQGPLQATLQALNRPGTALVNTLIGSIIKLGLIYLLAAKPTFGILGAIMAIILNTMIVTVLHWNSVSRLLRFSLPSSVFMKTALASAAVAFFIKVIMTTTVLGTPFFRFSLSLVAGTLIYLAAILLFRLVDRDDLRKLPMPRFTKK